MRELRRFLASLKSRSGGLSEGLRNAGELIEGMEKDDRRRSRVDEVADSVLDKPVKEWRRCPGEELRRGFEWADAVVSSERVAEKLARRRASDWQMRSASPELRRLVGLLKAGRSVNDLSVRTDEKL